MRPRNLPDGPLVSCELRRLLALIAIDDIENLDPPIRSSTRELLAIVVKLDVVLREQRVRIFGARVSRKGRAKEERRPADVVRAQLDRHAEQECAPPPSG